MSSENRSRGKLVEVLNRMVWETDEKDVPRFFRKVPDSIRRVNKECYEPEVISFGLYMRNGEKYAMMENVKREVAAAVLKVLLKSTESSNREIHNKMGRERKDRVQALWNHLCDQVVKSDDRESIWKLYDQVPQGEAFLAVQDQLVLDAMFLVSFMLFQYADRRTRSVGLKGFEKYVTLLDIFTKPEFGCDIRFINSDIWLYENQIPLDLILRMAREMYLGEQDDVTKNICAERATEILLDKTSQEVFKFLPGNYTPGPVSNDKQLNMKHYRRISRSLLECLYLVLCPKDMRRSQKGADPDALQRRRRVTTGYNLETSLPLRHSRSEENTRNKFVIVRIWSHAIAAIHFMKIRNPDTEQQAQLMEEFHSLELMEEGPIKGKDSLPEFRQQHLTSESEICTNHKLAGIQQEETSVEHESTEVVPPLISRRSRKGNYLRIGTMEEASNPECSESEVAITRGDVTEIKLMVSSTKNMDEEVEEMKSQSRLVDCVFTGRKHKNQLDSGQEPANLSHNSTVKSPSPPEFDGGNPQFLLSPADSRKSDSSATQVKLSAHRREMEKAPEQHAGTSTETSRSLGRQVSNIAKSSPHSVSSSCSAEEVGDTRLEIDSSIDSPAVETDTSALGVPCTVSALREVGMTVTGDPTPGCHCKVTLTKKWNRSPILLVSPLHVDGKAERLLRNLVAFEMLHVDEPEQKLVTYLQCLDDLINTHRDVSRLKEGRHPVIRYSSLDEKEVAALFNKLLEGCAVYNKELVDIRQKVRFYYHQAWRHPMTELKDNYLNHRKPWVVVSVLAASWLLILATVQTLYTGLGYYKRTP